MYLAADARTDHDTLCAFRRQHPAALAGLFVETLRIAEAAGLLTLGRMAIDGSKTRANASKHTAMSYGRMPERCEIPPGGGVLRVLLTLITPTRS